MADHLNISFSLKAASPVELCLYNQKGQLVYSQHYPNLPQGRQQLHIYAIDAKGKPLASGVYLCRITTAEGSQTKKISVIK